MDPVRYVTRLSSYESRNGTNDELLTIEREAPDWPGIWKKAESDCLERQDNTISAWISPRRDA